MAQLNQLFDAASVEPSTPFEVLPAGKYIVQIVQSEMLPTSNGNGQFLKLEMEILDGEHQGRRLFDRLNLINPNQQAVEIAQRALSAICHAVGVMQVQDSEMLHFKPMTATVKVRPAGPDKGGVMRNAQNEIGGYSAATGAAPSTGRVAAPRAATPQAAPAKAPVAAAAPPWRRVAAA